MLCVLILYISNGSFSLKSIPKDKFLRNFSCQCINYSQSLFLTEIYWEKLADEILFCVLISGLGLESWLYVFKEKIFLRWQLLSRFVTEVLRVNEIPMKIFIKMFCSNWTLNLRSCLYKIKTHNVNGRRSSIVRMPNWRVVMSSVIIYWKIWFKTICSIFKNFCL